MGKKQKGKKTTTPDKSRRQKGEQLTEQRKLLVEEYVKMKCTNQRQAAIKAGYSPQSAESQASQILKIPIVAEYLELKRSEVVSDLQRQFVFDALDARKVMYNILMDNRASNKDRISVAKDFLDRAGFKDEGKINITTENDNTVNIILKGTKD